MRMLWCQNWQRNWSMSYKLLQGLTQRYPAKDLASKIVLLDWNGLFAWTCWFLIGNGAYCWPGFPHFAQSPSSFTTLWHFMILSYHIHSIYLCVKLREVYNWLHDRPHCAAPHCPCRSTLTGCTAWSTLQRPCALSWHPAVNPCAVLQRRW